MFYCKLQDRRARQLAESAIKDVMGKINYLLLESDEEGKRKVKEEVEKCAKDAKKVEEFVQNNKEKVEETLEKIDEEHKPLYKRAWDFLCYAVKKGVSFIFDHIFDILKLIAILTIGFFCFPLLKKLWNWIEDALKKGEERKKELEVAKHQIDFQKNQEKESVPLCVKFLDDPDSINDNLPEGYAKRQDFSIQFVKDLPDDVKEKLKAWIMVNDLKGRKLNVLGGAAGDWVGGLDNALSPLEHGARTLKDSPTGRKTHRAQMDAQERTINWDVLPGGRAILVMSAIPSRKRNNGSLDTRRWNWLMKQVDAWDQAGRPSVIVNQTGSRRVQIDRDLDPGVPTDNDGVDKHAPKPGEPRPQDSVVLQNIHHNSARVRPGL